MVAGVVGYLPALFTIFSCLTILFSFIFTALGLKLSKKKKKITAVNPLDLFFPENKTLIFIVPTLTHQVFSLNV